MVGESTATKEKRRVKREKEKAQNGKRSFWRFNRCTLLIIGMATVYFGRIVSSS